MSEAGIENMFSLSVSQYSKWISIKVLDMLISVKSKSSSISLIVRDFSFSCLIVILLIRC